MKNLIPIIAMSIVIVGCDSSSKPKLIAFTPEKLTVCEPASEVLVRWDVRNEFPNVKAVRIYVADANTETLFAEGDAFGETKTGAWVRPGSPRFLVKNKDNGQLLSEGIVSGPKCQ